MTLTDILTYFSALQPPDVPTAEGDMNTEVNEEEEMKDSPENEEEPKDDQNSGEKLTLQHSIEFHIAIV